MKRTLGKFRFGKGMPLYGLVTNFVGGKSVANAVRPCAKHSANLRADKFSIYR